jgi:hypothetical protein
MTAIKFILAGGAGLAALAAAAPASAQYYPAPGYGYGGGNVLGQVLGQVLGGGGYGGGYGAYGGGGSQMAVNQCSAAVSDRLNRQYGGYAAYGGYNGYAGGARVVQISSVEPRSNGRMRVRGVAQTSAGGGYNGYGQNFAFKCNVDYRGYISDIDLDRLNSAYGNVGYGQPVYSPYGNYRRY